MFFLEKKGGMSGEGDLRFMIVEFDLGVESLIYELGR